MHLFFKVNQAVSLIQRNTNLSFLIHYVFISKCTGGRIYVKIMDMKQIVAVED